MKKWTTPITEVQDFVANEYVAACWGVECANADLWDQGIISMGQHHNPEACGDITNQSIQQLDDGSFRIVELKGNRGLTGTIYSDSSYTNGSATISESQVEALAGKTIYWTTTYWGVTYKHKGTVHLSDEGRTSKHS